MKNLFKGHCHDQSKHLAYIHAIDAQQLLLFWLKALDSFQ